MSGKATAAGRRLRRLLAWILLTGLLVFGALEAAVLTGGRTQLTGDPQVMVIFGCQVHPWGPSVLLQERLDTALDYLEDHPDIRVVVSGGQGPDEPFSEARGMADYLVEQGVPGEQIWQEGESHNTWQNVNCTMELLAEQGLDTTADVLLVSNSFHLTRVRMLWARAGAGDTGISTLAAPSSHVPSRLKMYLREPLALAKSFLFDR